MQTRRIHITGASGSGVTTLGRALADALALPHHDTDDYLWLPTAALSRAARGRGAPAADGRDVPAARRLGAERRARRLGRSACCAVHLVVFLRVPNEVRIARLREREAQHFGTAVVAPGGWRHAETEDFIAWASHYEDGTREGRSLARQEVWLGALPCPVLRLDGMQPVRELVAEIAAALPS